ncbi:winged helix-turn-helix domain-containing protein [Acaryochloris marina]|nr:winged helix-turn-helix domain-containing protein [Acaryochloris marina]
MLSHKSSAVYLKRLEQSLQCPRPHHRKGEPEAQAAFKKTS